MFAVSISLGASNAYVAVAQLPSTPAAALGASSAPIKVIANSSGHRATPVAAALTEQEVLFGENAIHCFARHPQKVVPYLFAYTAAAAAVSDSADGDVQDSAAAFLLRTVAHAAGRKYKGHCPIGRQGDDDDNNEGAAAHQPMGFSYDTEQRGELVERFTAAEDLFVQFLNHIKVHSVDGACGLMNSSENQKSGTQKKIILTLVVPRYAFPSAAGAGGHRRAEATEWLQEAIGLSDFGSVCVKSSVVFSDEAALLAFDTAPSRAAANEYFLLPANAHPQPSLAPTAAAANVLVVDWGAHALCLTLLQLRGGMLVHLDGAQRLTTPYFCATGLTPTSESDIFASIKCCGGDALDVALAERVAAQYMVQQQRHFAAQVRNVRAVTQLNHNLTSPSVEGGGSSIIAECIPARAMRRLRLLMEEKKLALNTNPQAMGVSVEMEAFYEGMDLVDNQTFNRNKFEIAVRSEWSLPEMFERTLAQFIERNGDALSTMGISHVLLTGGMCQMPVVSNSVAALLTNPTNPTIRQAVSQPVAVLDSACVGNGVAADELAAVGGCLNSYHLGLVSMLLAEAKVPLKGKQSRNRNMQDMRKERVNVLSGVWRAMNEDTNSEEDNDDVEGDNEGACVESDTHAGLLQRNVYLYVDEDVGATVQCGGEGAWLPTDKVALLFAKYSPLPMRVLVRCPSVSASDRLAVSLLTEVNDRDAVVRSDGKIHLRLAAQQAVTVTVPPLVGPTNAAYVAFTSKLKDSENADSGNKRVVVSVQAVAGEGDCPPAVITPGNSTEMVEVILH